MHYRIFSILVTFVCLFGCALTTAAQDVNNTDETEKPVILYSCLLYTSDAADE